MPTDNDPMVRILGTCDFGVDIGNGGWFVDALPLWFQPSIFFDLQVAAKASKAPDKPVRCGIHTALTRQGMPCRESTESHNRLTKLFSGDTSAGFYDRAALWKSSHAAILPPDFQPHFKTFSVAETGMKPDVADIFTDLFAVTAVVVTVTVTDLLPFGTMQVAGIDAIVRDADVRFTVVSAPAVARSVTVI